jgi:hypothetical protein
MQGIEQIISQNERAAETRKVNALQENGLFVVADWHPRGYVKSYEVFGDEASAKAFDGILEEGLTRKLEKPAFKTGFAGTPLGLLKTLKEGKHVVVELVNKAVFRNHVADDRAAADKIVAGFAGDRSGFVLNPV